MKLYIYNNQNNIQRSDFFISEITEDLLWSGDSWEQFTSETGFDASHVGGLIMKGEQLIFSPEKQQENISKPIAMGNDLVQYIESQFIGVDWETRKALQQIFVMSGLKPLLESRTCNPFHTADITNILSDLNTSESLTDSQKKQFVDMLSGWLETVKTV